MAIKIFWTAFAKRELKNIFDYYKIIYWVNEEKNRIEIVDIFDARQNPLKIEREK